MPLRLPLGLSDFRAVRELREHDYATELRAAGAAPVHALAVAFDGKAVRVQPA